MRTIRVSSCCSPCSDSQPSRSSPQNDEPKGPPFLPGALLVKLGTNERWMVFKAPYCTDGSALAVPDMKPAKSPQEHAQRTGNYFSLYYPKLCFTGPGCWMGESHSRSTPLSTVHHSSELTTALTPALPCVDVQAFPAPPSTPTSHLIRYAFCSCKEAGRMQSTGECTGRE